MDPQEQRRERALLLGIVLLAVGVILGWWLGRVVMVDTVNAATAAGPAPTVTVTAPDDGLSPLLLDGESTAGGDAFGLGTTTDAGPATTWGSKGGEGATHPGTVSGAGDDAGSGLGSGSGSGSGSGGGVSGGGSGSVDAGALKDFTLRAQLEGAPLIIGEQRQLTVRISNPNRVPITLQTVRITVGQPSATGCQPAWLDVADYTKGSGPAVVVAARAAREIPLDVLLVNLPTTNQNACQGSAFPLALTGTARS